jgi:hypothetical protein
MSEDEQSIQSIVEAGLEMAGKQSKEIILRYISYKYGLDSYSLAKYKDEFANYLREILGHSADLIIDRIDKYTNENKTVKTSTPAAVQRSECTDNSSLVSTEVGREGKLQSRLVQQQKARDKKLSRISDNIHFVICDSCFWCATLLVSVYESRCVSCGREIRSPVPIANNERFTFEADTKRGISLSFSS